ncbi:MAG: nucleoside triphosphate pyrophosphohydrolase ham1 [Tremellales sp. Tagirdzhanova-0007]|nr:MAG: nucleoside triphosphate pyrophosphohydrolase ham1 [Tremellales sp. Tagirdzhanova-0007]
MTSFVFVTGNANKLKEVKTILAGVASGIEVTSETVDVPEIQGTTREIAIAKCQAAAAKVYLIRLRHLTAANDGATQLGTACVTEDTALCFEALGGLPGPYIKDFLDKLGHEGLNTLLAGFPSTSATALCTFAYSHGPGHPPILFEGRTEGHIVPARGPTHFGWDPIFEPVESEGRTYAEMDGMEKNMISHRYRALEKLRAYLADQARR